MFIGESKSVDIIKRYIILIIAQISQNMLVTTSLSTVND